MIISMKQLKNLKCILCKKSLNKYDKIHLWLKQNNNLLEVMKGYYDGKYSVLNKTKTESLNFTTSINFIKFLHVNINV